MRSTKKVYEDLISEAKKQSPNLLWSPKTPQNDIITVASIEFGRQYAIAEYIKNLATLRGYKRITTNSALKNQLASALNTSVKNIENMFSTDLDEFAKLYNITRKSAQKARGILELIFDSADSVSIPSGSTFTATSMDIAYVLIETISDVTPILSEGSYHLYVACEASEPGVNFNIVKGTRFYSSLNIPNLRIVVAPFNIQNGKEEESDKDFIVRIENRRKSANVGSKTWLLSLLETDERVYDVKCYSILDASGGYFNRDYGIDVWVNADEIRNLVNNEPISEIAPAVHFLRKAPLVENDPIITPDITLKRYTPAESVYARSVLAPNSVKPTVDKISYYIDKTIIDLQNVVEDADNWLFGGRSLVIVKKVMQVKIDIFINYYCLGGYDPVDVGTNIRDNILKYFVGGDTAIGKTYLRKKIEDDVDKSDLLDIVLDVEGVDRVDIASFKCIRQDGKAPKQDPVPINYNEVAVLGDLYLTAK